jgi:cell wall-associated NlpC family hydrolase
MRYHRRVAPLLSALIALAILAGCSSAPRRPAEIVTGSRPAHHPAAQTAPQLAPLPAPGTRDSGEAPSTPMAADEVVLNALALLGVPYRLGGSHPREGLDCSGLVRWAYQGATPIALPRRSEEMMAVGQQVTPEHLQAGDLVFFNTLDRPGSHVGIYIGRGRFIHAPNARGVVRIESLAQAYWSARFDGARRLIGHSVTELTAGR